MAEIFKNEEIGMCDYYGELEIGEVKIPCAVLKSGERIIYSAGLFQAFGRPIHGAKRVSGLPSIIGANNLVEFINPDLEYLSKPIKFKDDKAKIKEGYRAEIIPSICALYITANKKGALHRSQEKFVEIATDLIVALSKIGIIALIDEATGYQEERNKRELRILLEAYFSKEALDWSLRFPILYYKEIYRLYGWHNLDPYKPKKPQYVGTFTNKYVWDFFPEDVMSEIRKVNPVVFKKGGRRNRIHQHLTEEIGIKQLDSHLSRLITTMKLSEDLDSFHKNFAISFKEDIEKMSPSKKSQYSFSSQLGLF